MTTGLFQIIATLGRCIQKPPVTEQYSDCSVTGGYRQLDEEIKEVFEMESLSRSVRPANRYSGVSLHTVSERSSEAGVRYPGFPASTSVASTSIITRAANMNLSDLDGHESLGQISKQIICVLNAN